ncbi:MAG: hypothetical protein L6Q53_01910 [Candidatus Brocadia sinica]|nr:hypothetical protein [Candidatus Brocadia sinica]
MRDNACSRRFNHRYSCFEKKQNIEKYSAFAAITGINRVSALLQKLVSDLAALEAVRLLLPEPERRTE